ncbi:MutS protein msh4 [Arthrobotrys conoides]|uniref:DNA mismatch repair protein MSH3 n=1 Tax=Arthrobotrys conoides TaxID=74498 RepID=A0AAN8NH05_9PEZI
MQSSRPQPTTSNRPGTRGAGARPPSRPRTAGSISGGPSTSQQVICALTESRGVVAQVGLAFINISTAECTLCEICDSQTYVRTLHKLAVFDPLEILIPETILPPRTSKLPGIIQENLPGVRLTTLPRKYYNENIGTDYISRLSFKSEAEAVQVAISGKFYAISAAAAVIKHIEVHYNIGFVGHSLRVRYQSSEGAMVIDFSTVQNLELIQNLRNPKSGDCLFGLLNNTVTPMGGRLLRSSILQPLTDTSILKDRLDAVEELATSEEMFFGTKKALQGFGDMDKLLTSLITVPANSSLKFSEKSINDVILLKKELASITPIHEALVGCSSKLLLAVRSLCSFEKVQAVQDFIDEAISPDAVWASTPVDLRHQRCYAVKSGVNGLLDVARQTYKEATEDLHVLFQEIAREYNLPTLEIKYDAQRGYYLRLPVADIEDAPLPPIFVNIMKKKKFVECTTLDIMKRNARIGDAMTEVLLMSDRTIQDLIDAIRGEMFALYKVCEGVAMLDMISSFATLVTLYEYTRPEFKNTLAIKDGRHPIREKIHKEKLIPNDVYASQQTRFQIITGCNMSGKSTYIRQIALMTIMAQIGSYVPASYGCFPITTHLFARVSMDDGIEANVSTFAAEMRETAFILKNATEGSMVIMDELGRGTCTRDGLAIAIAVCEALIEKRAFVWFATHFRELGAVLSRRAGVVSLHMQVEVGIPVYIINFLIRSFILTMLPNNTKMRPDQNLTSMLYKIADGPATEKHYGINLARIIGLPSTIITRASEVSNIIAQNAELKKMTSKGYRKSERQRLILQLVEHLQQARGSKMTNMALRGWLGRLQAEFAEAMGKLKDADEESESSESGDDDETTTNATTTEDHSRESNIRSGDGDAMDTSSDGTPILMPSEQEDSEEEEEEETTENTETMQTSDTSGHSGWSGFTTTTTNSHSHSRSYISEDTGESGSGVQDEEMEYTGYLPHTFNSEDLLEGIEELSDVEDQI